MFSVIAWWTKITFFTSIFIILYLQSNIYYTISYIKFLSIFLSYGESLHEKLLMKLNCRIQNQFTFFKENLKTILLSDRPFDRE